VDYRLYVPSVPASGRHGLRAIDLLRASSGATDVCGAPIDPVDPPCVGPPGWFWTRSRATTWAWSSPQDAVIMDDDRQVEVKGRRKADTAVTRVAVTPW